MPFPFSDVTLLRLIEASGGPQGTMQVLLGGFCFDSRSPNEGGFQLPRWSQVEGGRDTGPLEADKATAASKLAQGFAAYWMETIKAKDRNPL